MVRSHIGNVVCRKALSVRVASSPPKKKSSSFFNELLFFFYNLSIYEYKVLSFKMFLLGHNYLSSYKNKPGTKSVKKMEYTK